MSSNILKVGVVLSSAMLILSLGCSDVRTPKSLINPDTGKHDAGWQSPDSHGAAAKAAAGSSSGFAACQECHADNFSGGISKITCLNTTGCHGAGVKSPHAPAPWRSGPRTHTNTDESNAPVCAQCHTNGANSPVQPSPFDPAAAPGCFNNTLCHAAVGHPALWENPLNHGAAAKSAPGAAAGFGYCQTCHGKDFTGGIALQTCLNTSGCHGVGVNSPHAPKPWMGNTRTHTDSDPGNAPVCAGCHTNGANSSVQPASFDPAATPGCFNNTLCHAAVGHPSGWALPTAHGATAKSAPSSSAGFNSCQRCHGNDFTGGDARQTCLNTSGCHGAGVNAPHAASWMPGTTNTHMTTDQGNAPVCALCHLGGRTPPSYATVPAGIQPGCFNNTLCHAVPGHEVGWADPSKHGASAKAAPNVATISGFSTCQTCHNSDFTGGISLQTCLNTSGCHDVGVFSPHAPAPWLIGTPNSLGALSHVSTDPSNGTVCALCHLNGANFTGSLTPPFPPAGTAPDCFNNTLCHAIPPACFNCHTSPPSGATAPNQAGSHAAHDALPNVTGVCNTCHNGAGIGTRNHNNGTVDVAFKSDYNAKSGPAAYNASGFTCSNISCHGGSRTQSATQAGQNPPQSTVTQTPSWLTGTIDVSTDCTVCHVLGPALGTPENNSYYSGRHYLHLYDPNNGPQPKLLCTACHDPSLLATNHLTTLNTPAMEGPASATIWSFIGYSGGSCFSLTSVCHGKETW